MLKNLTLTYIRYRNNITLNFVFGLILLLLGITYFIWYIEIDDNFICMPKNSSYISGPLCFLYGFRRVVNALDAWNAPRYKRQTQEWLDKNNINIKDLDQN